MKPVIAAIVLSAGISPLLWSQVVRQEVSRLEVSAPRPADSRGASISDIDDAAASLDELNEIHARLMEATARMTSLYSSLNDRLEEVCGSRSSEVCETSAHDALEYLELQTGMQRDSRQFTAISHAMKARHDAAKASIRNMR